ncbi:MAG: hypothetical protein NT090_01015, partial [Acidobacteria bacterium]|nr:hypothetical protein [Acidobacteriota bacterium]
MEIPIGLFTGSAMGATGLGGEVLTAPIPIGFPGLPPAPGAGTAMVFPALGSPGLEWLQAGKPNSPIPAIAGAAAGFSLPWLRRDSGPPVERLKLPAGGLVAA